MKHNLLKIRDIIFQSARDADFEINIEDVRIDKTKTIEHGHFACNIAMLLAGKVGGNPREVAERIISKIDSDVIEKTEVAGPGFINIWVEQKFYTTECQFVTQDITKYLEESFEDIKKGTMVIDTSHPNVAKPMGVHHLLSTVIGDSIKKIYKRLGYKVVNDNYLGDWGTQFGKLIYAIRTWGDMNVIEKNPIPELLKLYVKFHDESEKDSKLDDFGRAEFKKLEDGDKENKELWKFIVKKSLDEFEKIYSRLNIKFDVINGESFYEDKMGEILDYGRKEGIIVDGEGGSWIIMPDEPEDVPVLVRKSDGATLYATRDLARIKYWEKTWHPDLMVNVVDVAQEFYFNQLFFAESKLKLTNAKNVHVSFGRMQFKDAKMSTRKGNIILLEEVLNESEERAFELAKGKGLDLTGDEAKELARIMGIGAIKYNILSQSRTTNIIFDWDKVLSFEGNSAPYLMYTITRAKSVMRKSDLDEIDAADYKFSELSDSEISVIIQLMTYPNVVNHSAEEFKPNHIANYLYELAQCFNSFYNSNPIIKAESEDVRKSRLLLVASVIKVMEDGLALLGIEIPEKM
ncbi:arginine--tRNA ligase [Candidatus Peregrinibacteria bacterium]|nr:arginine--tRNA ligase [Candidatus Peregrinibacteria bacterium]